MTHTADKLSLLHKWKTILNRDANSNHSTCSEDKSQQQVWSDVSWSPRSVTQTWRSWKWVGGEKYYIRNPWKPDTGLWLIVTRVSPSEGHPLNKTLGSARCCDSRGLLCFVYFHDEELPALTERGVATSLDTQCGQNVSSVIPWSSF